MAEWTVVSDDWPCVIAFNIGTAPSESRTSPNTSQSGRYRKACLTCWPGVIAPSPSLLASRASHDSTFGCVSGSKKSNSAVSSMITTRTSAPSSARQARTRVDLPDPVGPENTRRISLERMHAASSSPTASGRVPNPTRSPKVTLPRVLRRRANDTCWDTSRVAARRRPSPRRITSSGT